MIDKTLPNRLQTDADQRLVRPEVGEMIDAQNVTIGEAGANTSGIIKNVKGTTAMTSDFPVLDSDYLTVIGSVSDPQRGYIYWFVADNNGTSQHAIYQQNTSNTDDAGFDIGEYRVVYKDGWLNFDRDSFVKADVLNAAFQQDGVLQTILYFTDNVNPPRKINVDRAIAGDYDIGYAPSKDHAISVIKAPLIPEPTFSFSTDTSIRVNNFSRSLLQFATQLVYVDGEESAFSAYSKLAFPDNIGTAGLDDEDSPNGAIQLSDNVCEINIRLSDNQNSRTAYRPHIDKVRILVREGNNGTWLIADEFDPSETLSRDVYGSSLNVYDPVTKVYRFYNQNVYTVANTIDAAKTYDNVPHLAAGQALAGNRLMYSNYTEGYANEPNASNHNINVVYNDESDGAVAIDPNNSGTVIYETVGDTTGLFEIALLTGPDPDAVTTDTIADASALKIELTINLDEWTVAADAADDYKLFMLHSDGTFGDVATGNYNSDNIISSSNHYTSWGLGKGQSIKATGGGSINISFTIQLGSGVTYDDLIDIAQARIIQELEDAPKEFTYYGTSSSDGNLTATCVHVSEAFDDEYFSEDTPTVGTTTVQYVSSVADKRNPINIEWDFDVTRTSNIIEIQPYPKEIYPVGEWSTVGGTSNAWREPIALRKDYYNTFGNPSLSNLEVDDYIDNEFSTDTSFGGYLPYTLTGITDTDLFNNWTVSDSSITNKLVDLRSLTSFLSFKAGSTHELGVVYFDQYGRHGFVNRIGQAYVKALPERSSTEGKGAATIEIDWQAGNNMPSWAQSWSIVYPGTSSFSDFKQYTVGSAHYAEDPGVASTPDTTNKRIYVSLKTLDIFKDKKGTNVDYSFTEGDKLRIVSTRDFNDTSTVYPSPVSDVTDNTAAVTASNAAGGVIEFNVVKVVVLDDQNNPLAAGQSSTVQENMKGTFLVLDAPDVNSGAVDANGNSIKYLGFDWFSITNSEYPDGTRVDQDNTPGGVIKNFWNRRCLVEIVSPRQAEPSVFYEMGATGTRVGIRVGDPLSPATTHGANPILEGDVHHRTSSCVATEYSSGWSSTADPADYIFKNQQIESFSASDYFSSRHWSRGRAFTTFEGAANIRRYNGITYSDAYAEDVEKLSLSSFNLSLANFFSLDSANGACNYIGKLKDGYLLGIQENCVSRIPVLKDILTSPSQDGIVSVSTNVLNEPYYYLGDYGCGNNPESVLIRDNGVFFVDTSRKKVVRLTSEGLSPISQNGVDSLFMSNLDDFIDQGGTRIVSGYDPEDNQYYVTLRPSGTFNGLTLGYNLDSKVWQSRYTFYPHSYSDQDGTMYSARYVDPTGDDNATIFYSHTNETSYNTFYGTYSPSVVKVVSNYNPSMTKVFNALSLETDSQRWAVTRVESSQGGYSASTTLNLHEGHLYGDILGDESTGSTKHIIPIGRVSFASVASTIVYFENRVNVLPLIPGGAVMAVDGNGNLTDIGLPLNGVNQPRTMLSISGPREITLNGTPASGLTGSDLVLVTSQSQNGDSIRGHWAEITLTNDDTTQFELFAVNTHFSESKPNHSLGQQ